MLGSASLNVTVGGVQVSTQYGGGAATAKLPLSFSNNSSIGQRSLRFSFPRIKSRSRSTSGLKTAVASVESNQLSSSSDPSEKEEGRKKYYFVVANAKFMLDEEEHFQEQLFERRRMYEERNKEQDFWLVIEPKFLDKFPNITKRLRRPAVALVSTNGPWITLDRVLAESFEADSLEEALASNPTKLEFEKPEKWLAPYPKYEFGWWEPFLPGVLKESTV